MAQKDEQLLLKDLCARLSYGVKVQYNNEIYNIDYISALYMEVKLDIPANYTIGIFEIKPYLRPMSSMTEEEEKEFNKVVYDSIDIDNISPCVCVANWLYSKYFDVYGLIPKGLALEAPEGMYN